MIPGKDGQPPLVTLTPEEYASLMGTLNDSARYVCESNWLFDYYEGKSNAAAPKPQCKAPELPPVK